MDPLVLSIMAACAVNAAYYVYHSTDTTTTAASGEVKLRTSESDEEGIRGDVEEQEATGIAGEARGRGAAMIREKGRRDAAGQARIEQGTQALPKFIPSEDVKRQFQQRYGIQTHKTNIAIVGESSMGKSSFINSLRGLSPTSQGAAHCGLDETSTVVQGYPDPRRPNIVWYDTPGARVNTPCLQGWTYFDEMGLFTFDMIIIIFADRFTQTTSTLISNASNSSIPVFLVRTKADQLIQNAQEDSDGLLSDRAAWELVVAETREVVDFNLARLGLPKQRAYLVSKMGMKNFVLSQDTTSLIDEKALLRDIISNEIQLENDGTDGLSDIHLMHTNPCHTSL